MKLRRKNNLLIEPPASATGDIAFNLIVFFLVCASVQPDSGRKQTIPRAEQTEKQEQKSDQNIQVELKGSAVLINGDTVHISEFGPRIKVKLDAKRTQEEKIVVVKSSDDVQYAHWISITSQIEDAGGIITLQLEEERTVTVP